jgi:hypothetical protein
VKSNVDSDPDRNRLGPCLKKFRGKLGISARQLSEHLERENDQFVAGIERSGQTSFEGLRAIIKFFEAHPELNETDRANVGVELIQAALGMELGAVPATDRDDDQEVQRELEAGDSIWIVSDVVAEDDSTEWLALTAANLAKGVNYTYFFPFVRMEEDCRALVVRLAEPFKKMRKSAKSLEDHLRIFQVSNLAFPITYRIIHPLDAARRSGIYSIRTDLPRPRRLAMPSEQLTKMVRTLNLVLELGAQASPKNGTIKSLFP